MGFKFAELLNRRIADHLIRCNAIDLDKKCFYPDRLDYAASWFLIISTEQTVDINNIYTGKQVIKGIKGIENLNYEARCNDVLVVEQCLTRDVLDKINEGIDVPILALSSLVSKEAINKSNINIISEYELIKSKMEIFSYQ